MKYDELLADLRGWTRVCVSYEGSIDELLDKAADAIEELQKENLRLHAFNDANLEARDMLNERIKELTDTNVGKWIPVTERLPQKCQFYLVTDFGVVEEAYYNSDCVWLSRYDDKLKDVTHWMPLPEPPKDGET